MMKLRVALVISAISILTCFHSRAQSEKETYEILQNLKNYVGSRLSTSKIQIFEDPLTMEWNQFLNYSVLNNNISWSIDTNIVKSPFDPILLNDIITSEDLVYMKISAKKIKPKRWKGSKINSKQVIVIKEKSNFHSLQNPIKEKAYYIVSNPVFSENMQIAILQVEHYCSGECGSGILLILRKNNGKWERLCTVELWMS